MNIKNSVKRLTERGLYRFNMLKKLFMIDCIEGRIENMPNDGEILEAALAALLKEKERNIKQ